MLHDLPYKINQTINEAVKGVVQIALQAPLRERFRDLSEADMKEILYDWMFKSGTDRSHPEHVALYEALKASMEHSEDTCVAHLPKIKTRPDRLKPVPEEDKLETPELDWVIPPNDLPEPENNWANAFATS
ncbi:hypothetical protein Tco_0079100 [Tanacetum coccineum]